MRGISDRGEGESERKRRSRGRERSDEGKSERKGRVRERAERGEGERLCKYRCTVKAGKTTLVVAGRKYGRKVGSKPWNDREGEVLCRALARWSYKRKVKG